MHRLKDLVTILYQPRETMRRILDRPDRWSLQVVFLAFVCASVNNIDPRFLSDIPDIPRVGLFTALVLMVLAIVGGALVWIATLFILGWIATPVGRLMEGQGTQRDVRAALAWAIVPIIWSPIYRLPLVLLSLGQNIERNPTPRKLLDFVSHGGCSIVVLFFGFQLLFAIACVILASFTIAEAQKFSTQKGFVNAVITIALPLMVLFAAIFTLRR